eukprot:m.76353 g.76353  ORF g.76353 m.76353 type:complete len:74 (-) comp7865_c0_seq1:211-432(-)
MQNLQNVLCNCDLRADLRMRGLASIDALIQSLQMAGDVYIEHEVLLRFWGPEPVFVLAHSTMDRMPLAPAEYK